MHLSGAAVPVLMLASVAALASICGRGRPAQQDNALQLFIDLFVLMGRPKCAPSHAKGALSVCMYRHVAVVPSRTQNMAIVDHFKPVEGSGFMRSIDPHAARRQLNMSVGLVAVLAIVAAVTALSFRFEPQILAAGMRAPVKLIVEIPHHVRMEQAAAHARQIPSG